MCRACGRRPQAYSRRGFCFDCKPGIAGLPRPCRRCGATGDYWAAGLCARCHRNAPQPPVDSCADCFAWGATRTNKWLCEACRGWRKTHRSIAACRSCGHVAAIDGDGSCRLCRRQRLLLPEEQRDAARVDWHQLFLAGMSRPAKRLGPRPRRAVRRDFDTTVPLPQGRWGRQLRLFDLPPVPRPPIRPRLCRHCGQRPVKMAWADHCHACTPGGPVTPPPCRRCGSSTDYYSAGLCARCHKYSPVGVGTCLDCFAWGATRTNSWRCEGCRGWQRNHRLGTCVGCGRPISVGPRGACRLCYLEAARRRRRDGPWEFTARYDQQLAFADMRLKAGRRRPGARPRPPRPLGHYPVAHRQGVFFTVPHDLVAAAQAGFAEPKDPELVRYLDHHLESYAAEHGWGISTIGRTRQGLRILCSLQDTPGAPIKGTDVMRLPTIEVPADPVLVVLDIAGMLDDDRPSTFGPWLDAKVAGLPSGIAAEIRVAAETLLHGHPAPPRMRPRPKDSVQETIRAALPAIRAWADQAHTSLREISRHDVLTVIAAAGPARTRTLTALRHLFRVLKARQVVFVNPTARIRAGGRTENIPLPADLDTVRAVLRSEDPVVAAMAGLAAFHALTPAQLSAITLTDVRDGRLHIAGRVIVLAEPVRRRLGAYLDHRARRWPATANPYLFLHHRNALRTKPPKPDWISLRLGGMAQIMREDRILDELLATGGDIRRLCDLFGLSVSGAERYLSALNHHELDPADESTNSSIRNQTQPAKSVEP